MKQTATGMRKYESIDHGISLLDSARARRRWRFAFTAIYSIRAMLSLAVSKRDDYYNSGMFEFGSYMGIDMEPRYAAGTIETMKINSKHEALKRWHVAYATISFVQRLISLVDQDIISDKQDLVNFEILQEESDVVDVNEISCSKVDQKKLIEMVKNKNMVALRELGEAAAIATSLGTNPENGINDNGDDVSKRRDMFGSNTYHKRPPKSFFHFVVEAFKDTTILILLVCAALALGFGIKEHGIQEGWYEGGSIFVAVGLVVVVSAISNFRQEMQFEKLSKISNNIKVEVLRDERRIQVSIFDIVVGDVVVLRLGDQIPADGLFLNGHSLHVDESSMTGESDHLELNSTENPFLLSGTKVVNGHGQMLVTSVGMDTAWGEMMSSISRDSMAMINCRRAISFARILQSLVSFSQLSI